MLISRSVIRDEFRCVDWTFKQVDRFMGLKAKKEDEFSLAVEFCWSIFLKLRLHPRRFNKCNELQDSLRCSTNWQPSVAAGAEAEPD